MKEFKQIKTIKELMQEDFAEKIGEVALYLDKRLCNVKYSRLFNMCARKQLSKLTGESDDCMMRIHHLVRVMLQRLGELYPEYAYPKGDIDAICNASLFHDIGKFFLPQDILDKPDKLFPEEADLIHRHTEYGYELVRRFWKLSSSPYERYFSEICRYHHERFDGNGYPFGLSGNQIPIYVQVVSLIDVYDALISRRDYKPTYTHAAAIEMIESGECGVFNPILLNCFRQVSEQLRLEAAHYRTTTSYKQAWLYRSLKRLNLVVSLGLVSVVAMIGINIGIFASNLHTSVQTDKLITLRDTAKTNTSTWSNKIYDDISLLTIEGVRQFVDEDRTETGVKKDPIYNKIAQERGYQSFAIYYKDQGIHSSEKQLSGVTFDTLKRGVNRIPGLARQDAILSLCNLNFDQDNAEVTEASAELDGFYIYVPIFPTTIGTQPSTQDEVIGFALCAYSTSDIAKLIYFAESSNLNTTHVFVGGQGDFNGTYVMKPEAVQNTNNFYTYAEENFNFLGTRNLDTMNDALSRYEYSYLHYELSGVKYYACCAPMLSGVGNSENITGLRDWRIFVSVNESAITSFVNEIQRSSIIFFVIIGVCLAGLIILISMKLAQVLRITREMAMQNDDIRQNLELSESKYKTILAQTKHLVFEFDHVTRIVTHTEATAARYGFPMVYKYDVATPVGKDRIHPDDFNSYQKMYHDILSGKEMAETNIRLKLVNGEYVWNRCIMRNIYNEEKRAVRSIGFAEDVNSILAETQHLRDTAKRDGFTGIYNKAYTEILVNKELKATEVDGGMMHAFIIMDLDKFKNINDTYGHATGDLLLKNFATVLNRNARGYDLVGRVGGDEFVFFMQGIRDEAAAYAKAQTIIERAHSIGTEGMECSISVGIAFAPSDGTTYQELFEKADIQLYVAKKKGGDSWSSTSSSRD